MDIFLNELTNKYESKTLIGQKIKLKHNQNEPLKYVNTV